MIVWTKASQWHDRIELGVEGVGLLSKMENQKSNSRICDIFKQFSVPEMLVQCQRVASCLMVFSLEPYWTCHFLCWASTIYYSGNNEYNCFKKVKEHSLYFFLVSMDAVVKAIRVKVYFSMICLCRYSNVQCKNVALSEISCLQKMKCFHM